MPMTPRGSAFGAAIGGAADRIADPWGERTPFAAGRDWPDRVDQYLTVDEDEVHSWVQSTCVLCSNGCGQDVAVKDGRVVGVRGRVEDRANHGRLGPKGLYGWQYLNGSERLTEPLIRRDGELVSTDWDTAMETIVAKSREVIETRGPLAMSFYNTGQMLLEEYYALAMIAWAGIRTNNVDGNTRLCTATAEWALKLSFGCDGQPSSYKDFNFCDTVFLVGHNMAETETVSWMHILDRLEGPDPPRLVTVDPRPTPVAERAEINLPIRYGTNVALLNAIQHELIHGGWADLRFIAEHTVGFDSVREVTERWPPERAAEVCGVPAEDIRAAARILGEAKALMCTCLQGVYQSNQASAAAVQINNVALMRGMIGRPGCGVLQFNGQPSAENARECGTNGEAPGFRNWQNEAQMDDLARVWNVERLDLPIFSEPTNVMEQYRLMEQGNISFHWVMCTNPLVSLPQLPRIREILSQDRVFLVVQDGYLTETAQLADVVLPAAMWPEKTGTVTNADRTVHLCEKAIEPPGGARSDLEILLDYARRMDFRNREGKPLVHFHDAESAFEAWKECSRGRLCDYSALSYEKLRGGSGIQWPCNASSPEGTERLYEDLYFWSSADVANTYGKDLITGAAIDEVQYRGHDPAGRAIFRAADYHDPPEVPSDEYPLWLSTGRTVYHWHTRTKTGRSPQLRAAAPEVWVEVNTDDAQQLGLDDGSLAEVETPRGRVQARVRVGGIRAGCLFLPWHYGYWDRDAFGPDGRPTAANELTISAWDPVSKQPLFKTAAARIRPVENDS
jgi:anaerobic selenocysteine-containing dehydrogenase